MASGRPKVDLDIVALKNTLSDAEAERTWSSRSELFKYVGEIFDVSWSTVAGRVKDNQIELKTPVGTRGRKKGSGSNLPNMAINYRKFFRPFLENGVTVTKLYDLCVTEDKSEDLRKLIKKAWTRVRNEGKVKGQGQETKVPTVVVESTPNIEPVSDSTPIVVAETPEVSSVVTTETVLEPATA